MWRMRYLKYYRKIVISKLLVVSQINYVTNVIPKPHSVDTTINKMMFSFLWGYKKEKIKNKCMFEYNYWRGFRYGRFAGKSRFSATFFDKEIFWRWESYMENYISYWLNRVSGIILVFQLVIVITETSRNYVECLGYLIFTLSYFVLGVKWDM